MRQALAFVKAHRRARQEFHENFAATPPTREQERILDESNSQIQSVEKEMNDIDANYVERIKVCITLYVYLETLQSIFCEYLHESRPLGDVPGKAFKDLLCIFT